MKYVLIIGDGMADNPVDYLGGKTPLEHVSKPEIDALARAGEVGTVRTVPVGLPAGSDTAILSIFGCDPRVCYTGRAPLEAAASGIMLQPGSVAYRCNMVTYEDGDMPFEEKKILSHSAGSIEGDVSDAVVDALMSDVRFREAAEKAGLTIHYGHSFRHMAVQKAADITGILLIPPHDHLGEKIGPLMPSGCENATVLGGLMKLAHEILDRHPINEKRRAEGKMPANGIWFWAEGTAVALPSFVDQYGKTGAVISAVPLCHGIARLAGLELVTVEGATGELDTNFEGKAEATLEALKTHDFAALHLEAPDECTHNGDLEGKIQSIGWLSSRIVGPIEKALRESGTEFRMLILSDHKTLTSTRGHDGDPVPFILYDSREQNPSGRAYTEAEGLKGPFIEEGVTLMSRLFSK